MARRLLGAHAALVFVFLYAPILVVVVYAFNGGRQALVWDGFSTKWFGAALHDDGGHGRRSATRSMIAAGNAVVACILGTMLALALPQMWKPVRVPLDALVTMTLVDAGDRVRDRRADLLHRGGDPARARVGAHRARGLQRVGRRARRPGPLRRHVARLSRRRPSTSAPGRSRPSGR